MDTHRWPYWGDPSVTVHLGGRGTGAALVQGAPAAGTQKAALKVLAASSHRSKPLAPGLLLAGALTRYSGCSSELLSHYTMEFVTT